MWLPALQLVVMFQPSHQTSMLKELSIQEIVNPAIPKEFCLLPPELDSNGKVTYLEDCPSLERFETVPLPARFSQKTGTHSMVCCPRILQESSPCSPTDPFCPFHEYHSGSDYSEYDNEYDYEYSSQYEAFPEIKIQPKMSEKTCNTNKIIFLATCVNINHCPGVVNCDKIFGCEPISEIVICGFDESSSLMMVCCPNDMVEYAKTIVQKPRFPSKSGGSRQCEDRSDLCQKWKDNGGCRQDIDIVISKYDPFNGRVPSRNLFDFMQTACPQTCGRCGDKGCVDEHHHCPRWAREGRCVVNPFFMAHTCRESCGVCGFLSPFNREEQVVAERSYTDIRGTDFDCGRFRSLCEINGKPCWGRQKRAFDGTKVLRSNSIGGLTTSSLHAEPNADYYYCGATVISDRYAVTAAHCYDDFATDLATGPRKVRIINIRDSQEYHEVVEIKRHFKHPYYDHPKLYDDIIVLELGRRVEYNFEMIGDTPACMDQGNFQKEGKMATVQGFGLTELGTIGSLLETNVVVITNEECKDILRSNVSIDNEAADKISKALPVGLEYGTMCAHGIYNEEKAIFSGSCKGDSGGPLSQLDSNNRSTLIGIVSGGVDCGKGYPGWYTRVEYYQNWIHCIIKQSVKSEGNNTKEETEKSCKKLIDDEPQPSKCKEIVDDIGTEFLDLRGRKKRSILSATDKEICAKHNAIIDLSDYDYDYDFDYSDEDIFYDEEADNNITGCDPIFGCDPKVAVDPLDKEIFGYFESPWDIR